MIRVKYLRDLRVVKPIAARFAESLAGRRGSKAVDDSDVTIGADECSPTGLEAAISILGTDALTAPHNS